MAEQRRQKDFLAGLAALKEKMAGEVLFNEPLDRHTSIGVGGNADALVYPTGIDELRRLVSYLKEKEIPYFPVGNWTNIIVRDKGFRGVIIALKGLKDVRMTEKEGGGLNIAAEAGVPLSELVEWSSREGYAGMQFCAGIPGTVGGALKMNAGAFGREIKDIVGRVSILDPEGSIRELGRESLCFEYRNLDLPEGVILVAAIFHLVRGEKADIRQQVQDIMAQRRGKHPLKYRNAGSIFKNPGQAPAGRIIEEIGLKGTREGNAQISEQHGNFIVNLGGAKADDILTLIDLVQQRVWEKRGIRLETEVKIIGE